MTVENIYGRESKRQGCLPGALKAVFDIPRSLLAKERPSQPIKMLLEGMLYDDRSVHYCAVIEGVIPEGCNRIRMNEETMDLVGQWKEDGNEEITMPTPKKVVEVELNPESGSVFIIRPTTIITEDRRIYHAIGLLNSGGIDSQRLEHWLDTLHVRCGSLNPVLNFHLVRNP